MGVQQTAALPQRGVLLPGLGGPSGSGFLPGKTLVSTTQGEAGNFMAVAAPSCCICRELLGKHGGPTALPCGEPAQPCWPHLRHSRTRKPSQPCESSAWKSLVRICAQAQTTLISTGACSLLGFSPTVHLCRAQRVSLLHSRGTQGKARVPSVPGSPPCQPQARHQP